MKYLVLLAAIGAVGLAGAPFAHAQTLAPAAAPASAPVVAPIVVGAMKLETPWTRATPGGAKVAGGFVRITNAGAAPDRLVSGVSDISNRFEIHEMTVQNGIMTMRELEKGLAIPAGATVELKPGSYHVMFIDLKKPIMPGDVVKATLTFEKAGKVEVAFPAQPVGSPGPKH